jgi:hypothetical protein
VERLLQSKGYEVLWTPPYCPDLQPIELFWVAGKNHVARHFYTGRTMKETVELLRDGWYGSFDKFPVGHCRYKRPVNCQKLWDTALEHAKTKFIPLCDGISGTIGALVVDENYDKPTVSIPIDTIIIDLGKADDEDEN